MDTLEVILGLLVALGVLLSAGALFLRVAARQTDRAVEAERTARSALEQALRGDITTERTARTQAQTRIRELEDKQTADKLQLETNNTEICELRGQVGTLLAEMAALQGQVLELKTALEKEQRDNQALRDTVIERDQTIQRLEAEKHDLEIQVRTCHSLMTAVGLRYTELEELEKTKEPPESAGEESHPHVTEEQEGTP